MPVADRPVLFGPHSRRPGRDGVAGPGPRLGCPVDRRHAPLRPALVPAAAGVRREATHAVCAELGLNVWHDPHNTDHRFTRSRLRLEVLPLMEEVLGGGCGGGRWLARRPGLRRGHRADRFADRPSDVRRGNRQRARHRGVERPLPEPGFVAGVIRRLACSPAGVDRVDPTSRSAGLDNAGHRLARPGRGWSVGSALRNQRLVAGSQRRGLGRCTGNRSSRPPLVSGPTTWHAVLVAAESPELYPGDIKSVLLGEEQIQTRIAELGAQDRRGLPRSGRRR